MTSNDDEASMNIEASNSNSASTSGIKFQALYGVNSDVGAVCYLLQIDKCRILLDCGWTDEFDPTLIEPLREVAPTIDAVLISHASIEFIGALPYAFSKMGLNAPVYSTFPTQKMGELFLYDALLAKREQVDFQLFSEDDISTAMNSFSTLKYSQRKTLTDDAENEIIITPYPAGNMIGACIYTINSDGDDTIYAVQYNHKREAHLNGTVLGALPRPSLMIADSMRALSGKSVRRNRRDKSIIDAVKPALMTGLNVLIPMDTAGRVFELLLVLHRWWITDRQMGSYPLVWVTYIASQALKLAKSQLEWMSDEIVREFDQKRYNAFDFKALRICHTKEEVDAIKGPKCVVCSSPSLESGPAHELFLDWAQSPRATILLTSTSYPGSLTRRLAALAVKMNPTTGSNEPIDPSELTISLLRKQKVALEGAELDEYHHQIAAQEEKEFDEMAEKLGDLGELEVQAMDTYVKASSGSQYDLAVPTKLPRRPTLASLLSGKPLYPVFPNLERADGWDNYGATIDYADFPEDQFGESLDFDARRYVRAQEGDEEAAGKAEKYGNFTSIHALVQSLHGKNQNQSEAPSKYVSEERSLRLAAALRFVDFTATADGESIKNILRALAPKRLILVNGTEEATNHLAEYMKSTKTIPNIYQPSQGTVLSLAGDRAVFRALIKDALYEELEWVSVGAYDLAYVDSSVSRPAGPKSIPLLDQMLSTVNAGHKAKFSGGGDEGKGKGKEAEHENEQAQEMAVEGQGQVVPNRELAHPTLFIGDLKMQLLKDAVSRAGISAELYSGTLLCNNLVRVSRATTGSNELIIEGPLCQDYFVVRQILYSQFKQLG